MDKLRAPDCPTPKRVLFIVITDYPGGAERVSYALATELASRPGWQVEVKIVCARRRESFSRRVLPAEVHVNYGLAQSWYLSFPLLPLRLLWRRYDLIVTTHVYTNALLSAMRRWRLVATRRLVMRESMSLLDRFGGTKAKLFRRLYRAYGAEDLLIAQTSYMASHVRSMLPAGSSEHLIALGNPIDVRAVAVGGAEPLDPQIGRSLADRTNILFCGRLVDFKRPGLALDAFALLADEDERLQLVFVGSGPLEADTRAEASRRGLAARVLFLGQQTNPYSVMAACDYGLLTSANEGFPNVVLEMMASGMRSIVVTPCAGDLDSLTGVAVARTHEVEEIAGLLRQAIHSGDDRSAIYRAAATQRSPAAYVDRLLDVTPVDADGRRSPEPVSP